MLHSSASPTSALPLQSTTQHNGDCPPIRSKVPRRVPDLQVGFPVDVNNVPCSAHLTNELGFVASSVMRVGRPASVVCLRVEPAMAMDLLSRRLGATVPSRTASPGPSPAWRSHPTLPERKSKSDAPSTTFESRSRPGCRHFSTQLHGNSSSRPQTANRQSSGPSRHWEPFTSML